MENLTVNEQWLKVLETVGWPSLILLGFVIFFHRGLWPFFKTEMWPFIKSLMEARQQAFETQVDNERQMYKAQILNCQEERRLERQLFQTLAQQDIKKIVDAVDILHDAIEAMRIECRK